MFLPVEQPATRRLEVDVNTVAEPTQLVVVAIDGREASFSHLHQPARQPTSESSIVYAHVPGNLIFQLVASDELRSPRMWTNLAPIGQ